MNPESKGKRPVREVVKDKFFLLLKATSLSSALDRDHVYAGRSYGRNGLLLGWSRGPYQGVIEEVHRARSQVSRKTIGALLRQSLVKLFEEHNVADDADPRADAQVLDNILATLDSSAVCTEVDMLLDALKSEVRPWTAFVFVEGVVLKKLSQLKLGTATVYSKGGGPLPKVLQEVESISGLQHIPGLIKSRAEHCQCYLAIPLEGEDRFVSQAALPQGQYAVSALNLYLASTRRRASAYQTIGVLGQPMATRCQLVLKRTPPIGDDSGQARYSYWERPPVGRPYEVGPTMVEEWKKRGLDKVLQSLQSLDAPPGSVERRICDAVIWYSRAVNAQTEDEQYVGLTTALESLLIADEDVRSISQRLADAVSFLIGAGYENRACLQKRVKDLYKVRCDIVHSGVPVSRENLFTLDDVVTSTILAFATRETPTN